MTFLNILFLYLSFFEKNKTKNLPPFCFQVSTAKKMEMSRQGGYFTASWAVDIAPPNTHTSKNKNNKTAQTTAV